VLGLPDKIRGCLFDLDGVLTQTATVHDAAWQEMFDDFLRKRAEATGEKYVPFDPVRDYDDYVDGKPREEGTESFLASRGIHLPAGHADDPPGTPTVYGLSNAKNQILVRKLRTDGVQAYPGSVRYVQAAGKAGLHRAVVSSSANTKDVLAAAGIQDMFEAIIDGVVAAAEHLRGKPAPDSYLAGAKALNLTPDAAAVFEDALAGVESGRAGQFGFVVGVDRVGQADALRRHGADVVVKDLGDLLDQAS
jgi:beta-phosphoglucomutase family hydrolase